MAKKMRKLFAMLLTVCMVMSLLSVAASAEGTEKPCGLKEHTHTEECYETTLKCEKHVCEAEGCETPTVKDLICKKEPHDHTVEAGCYHKHTAQKCYPLNCSEQYDCSKQYDCTEQYDCTNSEEGHVHGEGCPTHTHGEGCAHVHGEDCPAHVHVDGCYDTTAAVICGKTEEALEDNRVCTKEVHAHVEDVTAENSCYKLHEHVSTCYETKLMCTTPEHTHVAGCAYGLGVVALVGETPYTTLKDAVAAANASEAGGETIKLMDNITMTEKLTVKKTATIDGNSYAIVRGDSYKGTFFTVDAGVTLTLDGVVIDGNNDWTFLKEAFEADAKDGIRTSNGSVRYTEYEEGAPTGSGTLIVVNGTVVLDNGTAIQNHVGCQLFSVANGAELITNEATITHNTKNGTPLVASVSGGGKWTINEGAVISNNHTHVGNGILSYMCGTAVMNGGEIYGNTGVDCNGCVMMLYGGSANFTMNGGRIYANGATYGTNNGWNPAFYVYGNGSRFTMNAGTIEGNFSESIPGVANNGSNALIVLTGGEIINTVSGRGFTAKDVYAYCPVEVSNIINSATNGFYNNVTNTGTLNGDSWFYSNAMTYSGGGTFDGDVTVTSGAETTMVDGKWLNGVVYVKAVGTDSTLTVKSGATIDGTQVRVLDSVASGDCTNATEASDAQAASYVEESGAIVNSPVLYYHRLAANQKQNIVVTYDYNGGLDACGWSGTQVTTTADTYLPTAEELARPSRDGYVLAGWKFAANNDPECLTMEDNGTTYYAVGDETITELTGTVRLIAQWTTAGGNGGGTGPIVTPNIPGPITPVGPTTPDVNIDEEDVPLGQLPGEEVEIGEEDVPLTELPEEDVPLAMAPETGDASAIWAVMSALSGAGLFLTRKKREDEE